MQSDTFEIEINNKAFVEKILKKYIWLTNPIRVGLPASPKAWDSKICKAFAVDLLVGKTRY